LYIVSEGLLFFKTEDQEPACHILHKQAGGLILRFQLLLAIGEKWWNWAR